MALTYDGSGKAAGLRLYRRRQAAPTSTCVRDTLAGSIATDAPLRLGSKALGKPFVGQIDDLRLYSRALTPEQIEQLAIHYPAARHPLGRDRQALDGRGRERARLLPHLRRARARCARAHAS